MGFRRADGLYALYHFAFWGAAGVWWPFLFPLVAARGVGFARLGLLVALWPVCALVAQPVAGWLCDRTGRGRLVLCLLSLAAAAALPLFAAAWGVRGELAVLACFALLNTPLPPLADALTVAYLREAGGDYGRLRLWGSLSFAVAGLGAGAAVARGAVGLRGLLLAGAVLSVPAALLPLALPVELRPVGRTPVRLRELLGAGPLLGFLALAALCVLPMNAHSTYFSLYLAHLGGSAAAQGAGWALPAFAEVPFFLWGPEVERRLGIRRTLALAFLSQAVSLVLIAAARTPALAVAGAVLQGPAFALFYGAAVPAVDRLVPPGLRASGQALLWSVCFGAGSVAANLGAGWGAGALGAGGLYRALALAALVAAGVFGVLARRAVPEG